MKFQQFIACTLIAAGICCGSTVVAQNVGIGTNTPLEKLHVAGNIKADTFKANVLKITNNAGAGKVLVSDSVGNLSFQSGIPGGTGTAANGTVGFGSWGDCSMSGITGYQPVTDTAVRSNDQVGAVVAISGNFAVIGMRDRGIGQAHQGYADIFQFNGTSWVFMQKLSDPNGLPGDQFGISVAISGNFIAVGSLNDPTLSNSSPRQGEVFIYQFNGTSWNFTQKLTDPGGLANDLFGDGVSISGNNLIAGSPGDDIGANTNQGSACIFQFNASTSSWQFVQKLIDPGGLANDGLGGVVSIADNNVFLGVWNGKVGSNTGQGFVDVFQFNGTSWTFTQQIKDAAGIAGEQFGLSVSISGNFAAVGAEFANSGIPSNEPGEVFIYKIFGTTWQPVQTITKTGPSSSNFGTTVALSGNYLMVGNWFQGPVNLPLVVLYTRVGQFYQEIQNINDPHGNTNDQFGLSVGLDGTTNRFVIGEPGFAFSAGKAIFGKF